MRCSVCGVEETLFRRGRRPSSRRAPSRATYLLCGLLWGSTLFIKQVALFDVAALGIASFLRSGTASRVLITAVLVNPVDAVRTGTLLGIEGTTAFGAASLAFLRFTHGATGAVVMLSSSVLLWMVVPAWLAARRLKRADI